MNGDRDKYVEMIKVKILHLSEDMKGEIFLFGSRARNDHGHSSDLDIGCDKMSREDFKRLERELSLYWEESVVPYDVDLVFFPQTEDRFRKIAEKDKIVWKEN